MQTMPSNFNLWSKRKGNNSYKKTNKDFQLRNKKKKDNSNFKKKKEDNNQSFNKSRT